MKPRFLPSIEALESRIAPAAIVNVDLTAGTLSLSADQVNFHEFSVEGILPGSIILEGIGPTLFHMGTGPDTALLVVPAKSVTNLHLNMAGDANFVQLSQLALAGDLNIDLGSTQTQAGDHLEISGATVKGNFNLHAEGAGYDVAIEHGSLAVKKNATFDFGDGQSTLELGGDSFTAGGNFSLAGGAGHDVLTMTSATVKVGGSATFTLPTGGSSAVDVSGNTFSVGKALTVQGGTSGGGNAELNFAPNNFVTCGNIEIVGSASPTNSLFSFANSAKINGMIHAAGANMEIVATRLTAKSILMNGGGVAVNLTNSSLPGGITAIQGGGTILEQGRAIGAVNIQEPANASFNIMILHGTGGSLKSFSYTGSSSIDMVDIALAGTKIAGTVDLEEGDGLATNTVNLSGGAAIGGLLKVVVGAGGVKGDLNLLGTNAKIGGIEFTEGKELNGTFSLAGSTNLSVKGGINVDLAPTGISTVDLTSSFLHVGKAIALSLGGDLTMVQSSELLGLTANGFQVTASSPNNTIELSTERSSFGAVAITLTGNENSFQIENLGVSSKLTSFTYKSTGAAPVSDGVDLSGVQISGKADVQMADGFTQYGMADSSVGGTFNLSMGSGAGRATIAGLVTFAKAVTINLGGGDDALILGGDGIRNVVTAKSTFSADGGAGANTITNSLNHFAVAPVLTGFH